MREWECTPDGVCRYYPYWGVGGYGDAEWWPRPERAGDERTYLRIGPQPGLDTAPPDETQARTATFNFGSDAGAVHFDCRLDDADWAACGDSGTTSYSDLPDGVHDFAVRAVDASGAADPSPAEFSWEVDNVPPETTLHPVALGPPAYVWFFKPESTDPGMGRMMVGKDGAPPGPGWMSPEWATDARGAGGVGRHVWSLAAIDSAGNVDPTPAVFEFEIYDYPDYLPPTGNRLPQWCTCPPIASLEVEPATVRRAAKVVRVDVVAPVRGTLRVRLRGHGGRTLGARTAHLRRAGHRRVSVKLSRKARAWLRTHRRITTVATLAPSTGGAQLRATAKALLRH